MTNNSKVAELQAELDRIVSRYRAKETPAALATSTPTPTEISVSINVPDITVAAQDNTDEVTDLTQEWLIELLTEQVTDNEWLVKQIADQLGADQEQIENRDFSQLSTLIASILEEET